jgi:hypothetical protein
MMPGPAGPRRPLPGWLRPGWRGASPVIALTLGALILVLMAAEPPLAGLAHQGLLASGGSLPLPFSAAFAVVGIVVAWRKPGNPLGWLMLGVAGFLALSEDASFYAVAGYLVRHGGLPFRGLALLTQPGWAPAIASLGLIVLLFPDGRLPSPRWRWAVWPYLGLATAWIAGALTLTAGAISSHQVRLDASGTLQALSHPAGSSAWFGVVQFLFFLVLSVSWLAALTAQVISYRRSSGERRQQLKWLLSGALSCLVASVLSAGPLSQLSGGLRTVSGLLTAVGFLALPACIGVGILKYRLFDIDRIISRTLAYALLTGLLLGVYAGLVLLATQVLGFASTWAVAGSTLAAAALFTPVRRRVQRAVDRRFNRARYDADRMVDAFAARLQEGVDLDAVRADLAAVVRVALEPAHVTLWINGGGP